MKTASSTPLRTSGCPEIGDGMARVFGDPGVLEVVIEDVVVDVAENHDEDDDVSVGESAIGEAWV